MKINIITPTYKRPYLLRRALNSVLEQTYKDINVLVVADGEDKIVKNIVEEYSKKSTSVTFNYYFTKHEGNFGGKPRILGIDNLDPEGFVCFLDDDNVLFPDYIQEMVNAIQSSGKEIAICQMTDSVDNKILPINESTFAHSYIDILSFCVSNRIAKICKYKWIQKNGVPIDHDFRFMEECARHSDRTFIPKVLAKHYTTAKHLSITDQLKEEDPFIFKEIFEINSYMTTDEELRDATIIDIGANKGYFSIFARIKGAKKIYAFEPNKDNFKKLLNNTRNYSNIERINKAVYSNNKEKVYSVGIDGTSTICIGCNENSVDCETLGNILSNIKEDNLILKIDCEGSEYDIFKSINRGDLRRFKTIYSEFHGSDIEELNKLIESNGFKRIPSNCYVFTKDGILPTVQTSKFVRVEQKNLVIDVFPFFNELDLLEIRLEELYDTVDYFYITEANLTHSGKPKPLYLTENISRFEKYKDKMVVKVVDLNINPALYNFDANWAREHVQRNGFMEEIKKLNPEDYIIVSDVDEIPRASAIKQYIQDNKNEAGVLVQDRFMYYLNYKNITTNEPQLNSKIIKVKMIGSIDLNGVRYCDKENLIPNYRIENAGWHFTFMGGLEKVIEKVKAFAHQEYNVPEKINAERMLSLFKDGKDVYSSATTWKTVAVDQSFPKLVVSKKAFYEQNGWIKQEEKQKVRILCAIPTKGRYDTTLPLTLQAVINQTRLPDEIIIFDDNDEPKNLVEIEHYRYLFQIMDKKKIKWRVIYGRKLGQHHSHQISQEIAREDGYDLIWRVDDDLCPDFNVLERLSKLMEAPRVGAAASRVLVPSDGVCSRKGITGKIENIYSEPNIQWSDLEEVVSVDHIHCSYCYRPNIASFELTLSKVASREETIHTYQIKKAGYELLVDGSIVSWHLKAGGGIRSHSGEQNYIHDEAIFNSYLHQWGVKRSDSKLVALNNGLGDHFCFKGILPKVIEKHKKVVIAATYPNVFFDMPELNLISIADAEKMLGSLRAYDIYAWMEQNNWKDSLQKAFEKMYL